MCDITPITKYHCDTQIYQDVSHNFSFFKGSLHVS